MIALGKDKGMVNLLPRSSAVGSYGEWKAVQAEMALTPAAQLLLVYGILGQWFLIILNRMLL